MDANGAFWWGLGRGRSLLIRLVRINRDGKFWGSAFVGEWMYLYCCLYCGDTIRSTSLALSIGSFEHCGISQGMSQSLHICASNHGLFMP